MHQPEMREAGTARATVLREAALVVAVLFGVVGVAGFIPGLTTHDGEMTFAGNHNGARAFLYGGGAVYFALGLAMIGLAATLSQRDRIEPSG